MDFKVVELKQSDPSIYLKTITKSGLSANIQDE